MLEELLLVLHALLDLRRHQVFHPITHFALKRGLVGFTVLLFQLDLVDDVGRRPMKQYVDLVAGQELLVVILATFGIRGARVSALTIDHVPHRLSESVNWITLARLTLVRIVGDSLRTGLFHHGRSSVIR